MQHTQPEHATTRWLDEHEQRTWRSFLYAAMAVFDALDREMQRDAGMPMTYYEILVHLSEAPGRALRMSDLATRAKFSRSRLSHAVSRLEQQGCVVRRGVDTDRRGQLAVLTDAGFAVLELASHGHVESVRSHLFDPLTAEQVTQLRAISEAILAGFGMHPPEIGATG